MYRVSVVCSCTIHLALFPLLMHICTRCPWCVAVPCTWPSSLSFNTYLYRLSLVCSCTIHLAFSPLLMHICTGCPWCVAVPCTWPSSLLTSRHATSMWPAVSFYFFLWQLEHTLYFDLEGGVEKMQISQRNWIGDVASKWMRISCTDPSSQNRFIQTVHWISCG